MSGTIAGILITACSTGSGGPSAASAIEELSELGAKTFIRVGTTGAIRAEICCGDLIITEAAIRHDGASDQYIDPHYPAAADPEVTTALIEAAERLNIRYHVGVTYCSAAWYAGQAHWDDLKRKHGKARWYPSLGP